LLDAAVASLANQATNYLVAGVVPQRMGSEHPNVVPYGSIFRLADGRDLVLAVGTERQWRQLAQALGRVDWAADARFADNAARVRNRNILNGQLAERFAALDSVEARDCLAGAGVPFGFVNDMREVFEQPEVRRVVIEGVERRGVRTFVADGLPRPGRLSPPPRLNEHGRAILQERLGYDGARIQRLIDEGAWSADPAPD
jgi:crotonobetainyl-CoA:carnitine CoA-transferase CaiB-like acyl-CoA transferase